MEEKLIRRSGISEIKKDPKIIAAILELIANRQQTVSSKNE
jgi:hypothetical protein